VHSKFCHSIWRWWVLRSDHLHILSATNKFR